MKKIVLNIFLIICFSFLGVLGILKQNLWAADLYMYPNNKSFNVGQTFNVDVLVSSTDQQINAIGGVVYYSKDNLELLGVSKNGSIIQLWVVEPSYDSEKVSFEGIILGSGGKTWQSNNGKIITLQFKAKQPGQAQLYFAKSNVLANDGVGTNVLKNIGGANFKINEKVVNNTKPLINNQNINTNKKNIVDDNAKKDKITDHLIKISSSTHPEQTKWYQANKGIIEIEYLDKDVTGVYYEFADKQLTELTQENIGMIKKIYFDNLTLGTNYLNIVFQKDADWSEVINYKLMIDKKEPSFIDIKKVAGTGLYEINIIDNESGVNWDSLTFGNEKLMLLKHNDNFYFDLRKFEKTNNEFLLAITDNVDNYLEEKIIYNGDKFLLKDKNWQNIEKKCHSKIYIYFFVVFINLQVLLFILLLYNIYLFLMNDSKKFKKSKKQVKKISKKK